MAVGPAQVVNGRWEGLPSEGLVISYYGTRAPVQRPDGSWTDWHHQGVDIELVDGTPVKSAHGDAVVHSAGEGVTGGRVTTFDKSEPLDRQYCTYEHLSRVVAQRGQIIERGDVLGYSGQNHLHFEIGSSSSRWDPITKIEWWSMVDWMPGVERIETLARGGVITPIGVMSHIMQGSQATMIAWAKERPRITPVSAHFTVGRDGRVVQHVPIRNQAWHAGRLDSGRPPTWRLLPSGASPNNHAIGIEHEGFSGDPWPLPQVAATIRVHRWLFEELELPPTRDRVIGHYETAPASRPHDPGPGWPIDKILAALQPPTVKEILQGMPGRTALERTAAAEIHFVNGLFDLQGHDGSYTVKDGWANMNIRWRV
jgi:hypothetical protein